MNQKKDQKEIEKENLFNFQGILGEERENSKQFLNQIKNQEKNYQQKIQELEEKQEEIGRIIEELENKLRAAFNPNLLPSKRPGVLAFPVENPVITQEYGVTSFALRAYRTKFHNGIDFKAPIGTPIFAAEDGKVLAIDNNDRGRFRWQKYQYGLYVIIEHPNNLSTLYAHLSRVIVKKGQEVKRGQIIGYAGDTGYSYGPHLHFSVFWTSSLEFKSIPPAAGLVPIGVTINPLDYLPKF